MNLAQNQQTRLAISFLSEVNCFLETLKQTWYCQKSHLNWHLADPATPGAALQTTLGISHKLSDLVGMIKKKFQHKCY